jgi:hypothetical protein
MDTSRRTWLVAVALLLVTGFGGAAHAEAEGEGGETLFGGLIATEGENGDAAGAEARDDDARPTGEAQATSDAEPAPQAQTAEDEGSGDADGGEDASEGAAEGSESDAAEGDDEEQEGSVPAWAEEDGGRSGRRRLSPVWFYAALGLTLASGVATVVTGAMALHLNTIYLEDQSDTLLRERGMGLQTTANVFIGVVSALGLATVLLAIFTDWSRARRSNDDDEDSARITDPVLDSLVARNREDRPLL